MQLKPENIRRVRDAIAEAKPKLFKMEQFGRPKCGTPGCIAGWAASMSPGKGGIENRAIAFFGLEMLPAQQLFYGGKHLLSDLTRDDALHVLDWLLTLDRDPTSDEVSAAWDRAVAVRLPTIARLTAEPAP